MSKFLDLKDSFIGLKIIENLTEFLFYVSYSYQYLLPYNKLKLRLFKDIY